MPYTMLEAENSSFEKQIESLKDELIVLKESGQRFKIVPLMLPHDAKLIDWLDKVK